MCKSILRVENVGRQAAIDHGTVWWCASTAFSQPRLHVESAENFTAHAVDASVAFVF